MTGSEFSRRRTGVVVFKCTPGVGNTCWGLDLAGGRCADRAEPRHGGRMGIPNFGDVTSIHPVEWRYADG